MAIFSTAAFGGVFVLWILTLIRDPCVEVVKWMDGVALVLLLQQAGLEEETAERRARQWRPRLHMGDLLPEERGEAVLNRMSDNGFEAYLRISRPMFAMLVAGARDTIEGTPSHTTEDVSSSLPARRKVSAELAVGMLLRWLATAMYGDDISHVFGVSRSTISRYRTLALIAVDVALQGIDDARIVMEVDSVVLDGLAGAAAAYAESQGRLPVRGVVAAIDGWTTPVSDIKKTDLPTLGLDDNGHAITKDPYYNGKERAPRHKHLLLWGLDGAIWSAITCRPGAEHDATLYAIMRPRIAKAWTSWKRPVSGYFYHILGDSAFPACPDGILVNALTMGERAVFNASATVANMALLSRVMGAHYSLRNFSEWGNASLRNTFPVLNSLIHRDDKLMSEYLFPVAFRLFNWRVRILGVGQAATTFAPYRTADAEMLENSVLRVEESDLDAREDEDVVDSWDED